MKLDLYSKDHNGGNFCFWEDGLFYRGLYIARFIHKPTNREIYKTIGGKRVENSQNEIMNFRIKIFYIDKKQQQQKSSNNQNITFFLSDQNIICY